MNLILRDPHSEQILDDALYSRIVEIDAAGIGLLAVHTRTPMKVVIVCLCAWRRTGVLHGLVCSRTTAPVTKKSAKHSMALSNVGAHRGYRLPCTIPRLRWSAREWLVSGVLVRLLLPLVHLLLERFRLFLVGETESKHAVFAFETVEERPVLVVLEGVVDLEVPEYTSIGRANVNEFDPKCVAHEIVGEHRSTVQPTVGPSCTIRVGNVEFGDGDSVNLVRRLRDRSFHNLLFLIRED